ncbi:MAG: Flagellar motor switch protein FliM [Phycisphaerales bacterium]|nr:Flagellar motor switch protein FliM [Phycisphaerales bacterium]
MPDVLDQSEVDALLAAVDTAPAAGAGPASQVFSTGGGGGGGGGGSGIGTTTAEVQVYDFKRPERVSKDQMRALEALHEGFGRNFGAALSGYLRTIVEVTVAHIEQLTYSEFIHSLPNPTCFNLVKADRPGAGKAGADKATPKPADPAAQPGPAAPTLDGQMCLEISPLIVYPIIDRLLGGSNADLFIPQRPLTQIEQRLVQRITDRAMHHLSEAWTNLTPVAFAVSDYESNPQLVLIVPPNETVVVVGFELKMGNRAGTMSLCIPYNVIEPVIGLLNQQNWFSYQRKGNQDEHVRKLNRNVSNAPVEVRALLAGTTMTLNELMALQPGDVITTDKPVGNDVLVQVEGKNKFLAQVGQFRGNKAVQITRLCQDAAEGMRDPHPAPVARAR